MKIHLSTFLYVACGREMLAVTHTNNLEMVDCIKCKETKIFKKFNELRN